MKRKWEETLSLFDVVGFFWFMFYRVTTCRCRWFNRAYLITVKTFTFSKLEQPQRFKMSYGFAGVSESTTKCSVHVFLVFDSAAQRPAIFVVLASSITIHLLDSSVFSAVLIFAIKCVVAFRVNSRVDVSDIVTAVLFHCKNHT